MIQTLALEKDLPLKKFKGVDMQSVSYQDVIATEEQVLVSIHNGRPEEVLNFMHYIV